MFVNGINQNYNIDKILSDISLHSGIPKKFYHLKNRTFGEWEIQPWGLYIFKDRKLGEGTFSNVYLAKWRETFVVAKVIKEDILHYKKNLIIREIDIMSKLHHPNIVQFLGYTDDPFIIVMEYIPNKNLEYNIRFLSKKKKINIMKDIFKALLYLHSRKPYSLIHRDIKPTNILLTNSKVAKITDFGLSKFYSLTTNNSYNNLSSLDSDLTSNVGTERYMAPEVNIENKNYTNKIDIYSCGIMLYEMFENKKYIIGDVFKWFWTPKKIREIIINMTNSNPDSRYSVDILLTNVNKYY